MPVEYGVICVNPKCHWCEDLDYFTKVCPECGSPTVLAYKMGDEEEAADAPIPG